MYFISSQTCPVSCFQLCTIEYVRIDEIHKVTLHSNWSIRKEFQLCNLTMRKCSKTIRIFLSRKNRFKLVFLCSILNTVPYNNSRCFNVKHYFLTITQIWKTSFVQIYKNHHIYNWKMNIEHWTSVNHVTSNIETGIEH